MNFWPEYNPGCYHRRNDSHDLQKRQKNLRIAVTDMIFLSRNVSPICPNTKPNSKRANGGSEASIPAWAKSNFSTCIDSNSCHKWQLGRGQFDRL